LCHKDIIQEVKPRFKKATRPSLAKDHSHSTVNFFLVHRYQMPPVNSDRLAVSDNPPMNTTTTMVLQENATPTCITHKKSLDSRRGRNRTDKVAASTNLAELSTKNSEEGVITPSKAKMDGNMPPFCSPSPTATVDKTGVTLTTDGAAKTKKPNSCRAPRLMDLCSRRGSTLLIASFSWGPSTWGKSHCVALASLVEAKKVAGIHTVHKVSELPRGPCPPPYLQGWHPC
jgi:hypothetical protein